MCRSKTLSVGPKSSSSRSRKASAPASAEATEPAVLDGTKNRALAVAAAPEPKAIKRRRRRTAGFEERIGYHFKNPALLEQGLTHISALTGARNRGGSYQRLEFLGDHVLGL